ncbi:MAG: T9SS type A sorting domain-containing protein [Prevotella sp.]|jgi:hypothetical protein|nr:T9SS type A sorting domain-containing protein [Prevotella sp.]
MKTRFFTFLAMMLLGTAAMQAQLLLEENFDYDAGRPLIMDAINSSDNYDGVTGWSTQNNTKAGTNCFNITDAPLTYDGYINSGIGNALKYNGEDGQGPFRLFSKNVKNDSTIYIAFMVNFPAEKVSGGDYFVGIKMSGSATDTNWGSRIFASVDPAYSGEEVSIGINKMSGGTTTWVNPSSGPFLAANTTHLFVLKYHVGIIAAETQAEEAGKYDDVMSLYINPPIDGIEPATPTLQHSDPNQYDLYRRSSTGTVIGGARAIYLRPSVAGNAPAYTIDGIRVGETWASVLPAPDGIAKAQKSGIAYSIDNKIITLKSTDGYTAYELTGVTGQSLLKGTLTGNQIDASPLNAGLYILSLKGAQKQTAKIIIR